MKKEYRGREWERERKIMGGLWGLGGGGGGKMERRVLRMGTISDIPKT